MIRTEASRTTFPAGHLSSRVADEIAFIDGGVSDLASLLAGLRPEVEPVLLSAAEPATAQIARAVNGREGLGTIHLIAHGRPGEVSFGAEPLSLETLDAQAGDLAEIGRTLGPDGALLLWSCHTAQGERGRAFLEALAKAAGTGVAAGSWRRGWDRARRGRR